MVHCLRNSDILCKISSTKGDNQARARKLIELCQVLFLWMCVTSFLEVSRRCAKRTSSLPKAFQFKVSMKVGGKFDVLDAISGKLHGPLARYRKLWVPHAPGMPGTFFPPLLISDPDTHCGTCVTHMLGCMPVSLISGFLWNQWRGKRSRHAQSAILRIWQEAHGLSLPFSNSAERGDSGGLE